MSKLQVDYRGTINVTISGKECVEWSHAASQFDNAPNAKSHPDTGLGGEGNNYCRNPDESGNQAWCYISSSSLEWEYCPVPACPEDHTTIQSSTAESEADLKTCGSRDKLQTDYVGNISHTAGGIPCMAWDAQFPHKHGYNPEDYPDYHLESNFCRNPGGHGAPWCYTMDPEVRYEYCEVPICGEEYTPSADSSYKPRRKCGSPSLRQADYRGERRSSATGRGCSEWIHNLDVDEEGFNPANYPGAGLTYSYCRNPGMKRERAWCYVDDGPNQWEYCDIPDCLECGTAAEKKHDYRGNLATTRSGKNCQLWADNESKLKDLLGENISFDDVVELNQCRNPYSSRDSLWCYIDPEESEDGSDWEYCGDVPDCEEEEESYISPYCGSKIGKEAYYRGTVNVTKSGYPCQDWTSQTPHPHRHTPLNFPLAGLSDGPYCRNPGNSQPMAWCYVDDPDILFEFCDVPKCPGEEECGTAALKQADYRGTISATESGHICQAWDAQQPHAHMVTPGNYPEAGLEGNNRCRNPDGSERAWCFTQNSSVLWEYCDVPDC